jgi:hypothetical protein
MPLRLMFLLTRCLAALFVLAALSPLIHAQRGASARRITWNDLGALQPRLQADGFAAATFEADVDRLHRDNLRRVREGDLDHLVFYILQSERTSPQPPIEPALSAKALVERLDPAAREAFLRGDEGIRSAIPAAVGARIAAALRVLDAARDDARHTYFRSLVQSAFADRASRQQGLEQEYLRVMRFVYRKEFVAQRADAPALSVAELYRTRGLSTDTAIEAGYVVYLGLGVLKGLQPDRRIRKVLIVGPGLDLAPRTAMQEAAPPESYQPWAVIDAVVSLGLASVSDLQVVAADINPRVVQHLRGASRRPPRLTLTSELREGESVTFSPDFRDYFDRLGSVLSGRTTPRGTLTEGHLRKTITVGAAAAQPLRAETLDIVTERLAERFDLVIATNILPYFDDRQLALVVSNIAAMLEPGGAFLHNEPRGSLGDLTAAVGLPLEQSRHAVIANVKGATAPLFDSVFLHLSRRTQ